MKRTDAEEQAGARAKASIEKYPHEQKMKEEAAAKDVAKKKAKGRTGGCR